MSAADVWSATSYKLLRGDAVAHQALEHAASDGAAENHPILNQSCENEEGVFVAVSDYMKMVPDQIAPWVPGGLTDARHRRFRPQRHAVQSQAIF